MPIVHAVAVYLKSQPAEPERRAIAPPDAGAMRRGAAIYSDVCASCHLENGVGQPRLFPPLGHDAMLQQTDPTGLLHLILAGSRIGTSRRAPSPLTMPSFAWKLSDAEIADVVDLHPQQLGQPGGRHRRLDRGRSAQEARPGAAPSHGQFGRPQVTFSRSDELASSAKAPAPAIG